MIKGKQKENKNKTYSKKVGMFNATVETVNPTKAELEKLLNTTLDKDPEYLSTSDAGNKKLTLSFWLKEKSGDLFNVRFTLEDTDKVSKTGKFQYINNIGSCSFAESKDKVPSFITDNNRTLREAKVGEELLYNFLRNWLSNLDYSNESTELKLDWKNLMKGKVDELRAAIENYKTQEICSMATVRMATDGKEYQGVYSYAFLPEYCLECFEGTKKNYKAVDKFIEKVTDPDYGCKDFYELTPLKEYDPSKNIINSNDTILGRVDTKANISVTEPEDQVEEAVDDLPF